MNNLFQIVITQVSSNPEYLVLIAAFIALALFAGRQLSKNITPEISLNSASTISLAAASTFAVMSSIQVITTAQSV